MFNCNSNENYSGRIILIFSELYILYFQNCINPSVSGTVISPVLRPALHFYSFHFILVIPLNILGHTVVDGSQISLPGGGK